MPSERILICGAGVAGSVLAFWLAKYEFEVVVIERSKVDQKLGQGIEIEEPALKVIKLMGILDQLEKRKTGELGFELVDECSNIWASFKVGGFSPTGSLELMRGDLTEVLYKSADEFANVTYRFDTTIQTLRQTKDKVIVDLEDRNSGTTRTEEFDFVVGADGQRSRTRQLLMGSPEELDCYKPVGAYVAYFSIPKESRDWPYSRLCHFPNRRVVWTRPIGKESKMTTIYLIHVHDKIPRLSQANAAGDRQKQKEALAEIYADLGWETPRVIEEMMKAENFYSDELVQVKLSKWSQGRVVLLGDAAWAPTSFTGEGNHLAILGGWVLAQELSRNRNTMAFEMYEKRFRSYVTNAQTIPLGGYAPHILVPSTNMGIWILRMAFGLFSWVLRVFPWSLLGMQSTDSRDQGHEDFDLQADEADMKKLA